MNDDVLSSVQNYFEQKIFRAAIALLTRETDREPIHWTEASRRG